MWYDIFINLITTVICAVIAAFGKYIWNRLKSARVDPIKPKQPNKKFTYKQFFVCFFLFTVFLSIGLLIPFDIAKPLTGLKFSFLFFSMFWFILIWGAFEAAMAFYPEDEIVDEPSDDDTHNNP